MSLTIGQINMLNKGMQTSTGIIVADNNDEMKTLISLNGKYVENIKFGAFNKLIGFITKEGRREYSRTVLSL